jgi:hypothetical protein
VIGALVALSPMIAAADPQGEPEQHAVCLLGHRGNTCTTIVVGEIDVRYATGNILVASAQAGLLVNRGDSFAFGVSGGVLDWDRGSSGDPDHLQKLGFVAELRGRWWLGDRTGLDLDVGGGNIGGIGGLALEYHDIIALAAGGLLYDDGSTTKLAATIGVRFTVWGVVAAAAH